MARLNLNNVVKVRVNSLKFGDVRDIFAPCGSIRDIHQSKSSSSTPESDYFISFTEPEGSENALRVDDARIQRISPLSTSSQLVEEYRVANPPASESFSGSDSQNIPPLPRKQVGSVARSLDGPGAVLAPSTNLPLSSLRKDRIASSPSRKCSDNATSSNIQNSPNSVLPSPTLVDTPTLPSWPSGLSTSRSPLTHIDSPNAAAILTVPCLPLIPQINMCLCGELFSYDLRSLQPDPREIVELLKCTSSERGNWMIVGASYRRRGNPHAAITVMKTMLEVMASHRIPDEELKPAFLLLSSCEIDLGRLDRADGKSSSERYQKSQKWLQKVYGAMDSAHAKDRHAAHPNVPSTTALHQKFDHLPPRPRSPSPHSDAYLQREAQSLRDRLRHHSDILSDVRSAKRKLEDAFDLERDVRRRLERQIDDLRRERDDARRMEMSAQTQMKHEVENRRRAEEIASHERDLRLEVESYNRAQRPTPSPYRT